MAFRVGIDVGGTFTDLIALDERTGSLEKFKVPSTPLAPEEGVTNALRALLERIAAPDVGVVAHSSTIATNALLGQLNLALPRVALLTTEGFRDVLEIGRQNRSEVYNLFVRRPKPLVAREDRLPIRERLDVHGNALVPLDPDSVETALTELARRDVGAVAVSLLHAYANPAHERAVEAALRERFPDLHVSISSAIDPEYREYERTSTTVVNALLAPLVRRYLEKVAADVRGLKIEAPLYVMQSNGGMATLQRAAERPATIIESGPASGVIGAAFLGTSLGIENVLSFDMGGTTAKAGTIFHGEPQVVAEFEAAGRTHSGRAVKGSGYPVRFPFVDLAEVSAGGGTIAWIDTGGALRVGPLSAGADPGPAAYGKGDAATVTDANIVLGRLNPHSFLGGAMPIDAARSRTAIDALLPQLEGLDRARAAAGIVRLVDSEMAKVLRIVSIERGHDPRGFTMMAFGGGGPLHACALAEELDVPRIVVPPAPGLFSAYGLLTADLRSTFVSSIIRTADRLTPRALADVLDELLRQGQAALERQAVAPHDAAFIRELDARYYGQGFELSIPVGAAPEPDAVAAAFHARHEQLYGYASPGDAVEIVSARLTAVGRTAKPPLPAIEGGDASPPEAALLERRDVYLDAAWKRIPVWRRESLLARNRLAGPAIVEQYDSCTLVASAWSATVDAYGNLVLERT